MNAQDLIASTACAAFATDSEGRIRAWNRGAEELLGHPAEEVLGLPCHEVVCGTDVFGNRFCDGPCSVHNMARRGEPIRNFQIDLLRAGGNRVRAGLCTLVLHAGDVEGYQILHLCQPVGGRAAAESAGDGGPGDLAREAGASGDPGGSGAAAQILTGREMEVLGLLDRGVATQRMASELEISVTTVRNHIQGILRKLGAHSRLEAVSLARRQGLL